MALIPMRMSEGPALEALGDSSFYVDNTNTYDVEATSHTRQPNDQWPRVAKSFRKVR
jgi:hypothetical protein